MLTVLGWLQAACCKPFGWSIHGASLCQSAYRCVSCGVLHKERQVCTYVIERYWSEWDPTNSQTITLMV